MCWIVTILPCQTTPNNTSLSHKNSRIDNIPQVRIDVKHLSYSVKNSTVTQSWSFPFLPADLRRRWLAFRAQPPSPVPPQSPSSPSTAEAAEAEVPLKATGRHNSTTNLPAAAAALPPPPLSYDLQVDSSTAPALLTPILRDISLSFTPGSLTGLMGPSGSGKTSLLQVLHGAAKHTRGGILEGSVLINGTPCRNINRAFRQMCSLVPQEDILLPELSVHETLTFAAELRLPQSDTREEREETVESVMTELGLGDCRNVRIGSVEKVGISGGQRRRVSIGLELLTDPSILLLDEPTSGLVRTLFYFPLWVLWVSVAWLVRRSKRRKRGRRRSSSPPKHDLNSHNPSLSLPSSLLPALSIHQPSYHPSIDPLRSNHFSSLFSLPHPSTHTPPTTTTTAGLENRRRHMPALTVSCWT